MQDHIHGDFGSEGLVTFADRLTDNLLVVLVDAGFRVEIDPGKISEVTAKFAVPVL